MLLLIKSVVGLTVVKLIIIRRINKAIRIEDIARKIIKGFFTRIIIFFLTIIKNGWDILKISRLWR